MPLLGFTLFKKEILSGQKKQTIRKLRKYPIKVDDRLYLYWRLRQKDCEKLGEAVCTETFFIAITLGHDGSWKINRFNSHPNEASYSHNLDGDEIFDLARRDGFESSTEMVQTLVRMHNILLGFRESFQVVRWGRLEKKETQMK